MNILFAAKQGFSYNRTLTLWNGLESLENISLKKFELKSKFHFDKSTFHQAEEWADVIYIPPFRQTDARFLFKKTSKPIVFDPLISTYLTKVIDYKQYWKAAPKYIADKWNFNSCDILLTDTEAHRQYFHRTFGLDLNKMYVLPIGAETHLYYPETKKDNKTTFDVGFYGSFVPLQGAEKIAQAAYLLKNIPDIHFHIIGSGYTYEKTLDIVNKHKLKNVTLYGKVHYTELSGIMANFDVALGIFGDSLKADLVIPNKVFHYAAVQKPIITKDTIGIKEIFTNNENILLIENKPEYLAEKILFLKNNPQIGEILAKNAYQLITENYTQTHIAQRFVKILHEHFGIS